MTSEFAIRSDFLIHWTGSDFDSSEWKEQAASATNERMTALYFNRLKDILKHGLWMTRDRNCDLPKLFKVEDPLKAERIRSAPMCCFTELKVSESRRHASQYGRLGIGVKRPFVFDRGGRPVSYFGFAADERLQRDPFREACFDQLADPELLNYFKPMNGPKVRSGPMEYELYSEAEWRIVFQKEFLTVEQSTAPLIIDPRNKQNAKAHHFLGIVPDKHRDKLRYLLPLGGWFAMIIYPSRQVKKASEADAEIRELIDQTRKRGDRGSEIEGDWPIELTLDACRHF